MCMVYYFTYKKTQVDLDYKALNNIWSEALTRGAISGDVNGDGDMDDSDELLILDKDLLLRIAGLRLRYLGSFAPSDIVKEEGQLYIGELFNRRTNFTHFVALDKDFNIVYDPIQNSVTAREGVLKSVRVFG